MLHPGGYSVSIHTAANVAEVKNCYLISGDIRPEAAAEPALQPFDGDAGKLYWQSTLLNGFDGEAAGGPSGKPLATSAQPSAIDAARNAGTAGDWGLALELWRQLKQGGPTLAEVDANIGLCLLKLGEQQAAMETVQQVLESHPDYAYARSIMAHIWEASGDLVPAREIWSQLRQRRDVPAWMHSSAADGELRCATALSRAESEGRP